MVMTEEEEGREEGLMRCKRKAELCKEEEVLIWEGGRKREMRL